MEIGNNLKELLETALFFAMCIVGIIYGEYAKTDKENKDE